MTTIQHLGIIMDGNRRWAKAHGLQPFEGHKAGYEKAEDVVRWCIDTKIPVLTLYAFSTENWQRPKEEVAFLLELLTQVLLERAEELHRNDVRFRFIGRRLELPEPLKNAMDQAEQLTCNNTGVMLVIAMNYGGRQEIVDAVNTFLKTSREEVTETAIRSHLATADFPDPDLIIRTSGEQRLSGFLTWQSAYSELYFTEKHWPDFSREDFDAALTEYAKRQRRFGR